MDSIEFDNASDWLGELNEFGWLEFNNNLKNIIEIGQIIWSIDASVWFGELGVLVNNYLQT